MGRLPRGKGNYRATEHNIDMFALARMLGEKALETKAGHFVGRMYGFDDRFPQNYATGTRGWYDCDNNRDQNQPVAADTQFWNLLADADPDPERKKASLEYVLKPAGEGGLLTEDVDLLGDGAHLLGVRFTTKGSGAQWENTASAVMGVGYYDSVYGDAGKAMLEVEQTPVMQHVDTMQSSLLHQVEKYGSVLASVRGGNYWAWATQGHDDPTYPGGSDTGIGWTYLRYPHLASTAWTGLMLLDRNPFGLPPTPLPTTPVAAGCPASPQ